MSSFPSEIAEINKFLDTTLVDEQAFNKIKIKDIYYCDLSHFFRFTVCTVITDLDVTFYEKLGWCF